VGAETQVLSMANRWIGIFCVAAMLGANSALFLRDVLPGWTASDPPEPAALSLRPGESLRIQFGIFDAADNRLGDSQTLAQRSGEFVRVHSKTRLRAQSLAEGVTLPSMLVRTHVIYRKDGLIDELEIRLHGLGTQVMLRGANYEGGDFPCEWQIADARGRFIIPSSSTRALGDIFRPFDTLPDLYVGRTWRLRLLNIASHIFSGGRDGFAPDDSVLVSVVAEELIEHNGEQVSAFRVEARRLRAWIRQDGRVLRQEVDVPLFGRLIMRDEPFDEDQWHRHGLEYYGPRRESRRVE
jgi:hypothetical protein